MTTFRLTLYNYFRSGKDPNPVAKLSLTDAQIDVFMGQKGAISQDRGVKYTCIRFENTIQQGLRVIRDDAAKGAILRSSSGTRTAPCVTMNISIPKQRGFSKSYATKVEVTGELSLGLIVLDPITTMPLAVTDPVLQPRALKVPSVPSVIDRTLPEAPELPLLDTGHLSLIEPEKVQRARYSNGGEGDVAHASPIDKLIELQREVLRLQDELGVVVQLDDNGDFSINASRKAPTA